MAKRIYVGNMSYDTNEEDLQALFSAYGEVVSADVITDRYTGRPRGFAFVERATEESAQAAIGALNGKMLDGREIKVDKAKPRPDRGRQPRW